MLNTNRKVNLMTNVDIKSIIKKHRIEADLTMKELADLVGVSEATVSRWESGNISSMKHSQIAKLCKALHISPALIVPGIDYSEKDEATSSPTPTTTHYYNDPEVAELAEELRTNPGMKVLFDASKHAKQEDLQYAADLLKRLKGDE